MKISFPRITYSQLRKLIQGYYEIGKEIVDTREVSEFMIGDVHASDSSASAGFLVSINILEKAGHGKYKVTEFCRELGSAIKLFDEDEESRLLEK